MISAAIDISPSTEKSSPITVNPPFTFTTATALLSPLTVISSFTSHYSALDNQWHLYTLTLPALSGGGTIIFNGGYIDCSGDPYSTYIVSDITLF